MLNRKANVIQLFFILGIVVGFVFVGIFALKILNSFGVAFAGLGLDQDSVDNLEDGITSFSLFDAIIPFATGVLIILFVVSAFYIESNPAFFFISLILLMIVVVGSSSFSNMIGVLDQVPALENETTTFDSTLVMSENFPLILTIAGLLFSAILYGLWRSKS